MKRSRLPVQIFAGYVILQLPSLALLILILILVRRWIDLPEWLVWSFVAIWAAKEVMMFPFVWRSYSQRIRGGTTSLIGARGTAEERLDPSGYVRVNDELWRARARKGTRHIRQGENVRVRGIDGLTLVVEPENNGNDEPPLGGRRKGEESPVTQIPPEVEH
jgi:membrane protein implicated in regulation of membrane protease activity